MTNFQGLLEEYDIPFVGTGSIECLQAFDKVKETFDLVKYNLIGLEHYTASFCIKVPNWFIFCYVIYSGP